MSSPKSTLYVITASINLNKYVIDVCEKSPKKFFFAFIPRLENYCFDLVNALFAANALELNNPYRSKYQEKAKLSIRHIEYMFCLGMGINCFTAHQREVTIKLIYDCYASIIK